MDGRESWTSHRARNPYCSLYWIARGRGSCRRRRELGGVKEVEIFNKNLKKMVTEFIRKINK